MIPGVENERRDRPATERAEELADRMGATERAEELADRMGRRLGHATILVGLRIRKIAALAREEVEDMWAEAQSLGRRDKP